MSDTKVPNTRRAGRADDTRAAMMRAAIGGEHRGRLHIDPASLDPTRDHCFVREEIMGERDKNNIQLALNDQGYQPVYAADLPGYSNVTLPDWEQKDTLVRVGGLVLCSRPKEVGDEARRALAADNADVLKSATRTFDTQTSRVDPAHILPLRGSGIRVARTDVHSDARGVGERYTDQ